MSSDFVELSTILQCPSISDDHKSKMKKENYGTLPSGESEHVVELRASEKVSLFARKLTHSTWYSLFYLFLCLVSLFLLGWVCNSSYSHTLNCFPLTSWLHSEFA